MTDGSTRPRKHHHSADPAIPVPTDWCRSAAIYSACEFARLTSGINKARRSVRRAMCRRGRRVRQSVRRVLLSNAGCRYNMIVPALSAGAYHHLAEGPATAAPNLVGTPSTVSHGGRRTFFFSKKFSFYVFLFFFVRFLNPFTLVHILQPPCWGTNH